jgi:hypothetical protein
MLDLAAIRGVITAIHAPTGEINDDIRAVDDTRPIAHLKCIPTHTIPLGLAGMPADDGDEVALLMEVPRKNAPEMPTSSGYNDAQRRRRHFDPIVANSE